MTTATANAARLPRGNVRLIAATLPIAAGDDIPARPTAVTDEA